MELNQIQIKHFISKDKEKTYFPIYFDVPKNVEKIDIEYGYIKDIIIKNNNQTIKKNNAIVDFSVCGINNKYIGSSGSDRDHIYISGYESSDGYDITPAAEGKWSIIVGAYLIPKDGVEVNYTITFTMKKRRLFLGETHSHTTASDGLLTSHQLIDIAKTIGLDYIFITDHNNYAHNKKEINVKGITVIPGTEWTHYDGHANMLGVVKAFDGPFYTNSLEETIKKLQQAQNNGALVVLNHPFCPMVPWRWGFDVPYNLVEVWNGMMSFRNTPAINWWHNELLNGKKISIIGGADFHNPRITDTLANPTMAVYANSREPNDIISALKNGCGFITYNPNGPKVDANSNGKSFGDSLKFGDKIEFYFSNLRSFDEIVFITDKASESVTCEMGVTNLIITKKFEDSIFVRVEINRMYEPGMPILTALVSNAIYFD